MAKASASFREGPPLPPVRRRVARACVALLMITLGTAACSTGAGNSSEDPAEVAPVEPFASDSPFRTPIADAASVDPHSPTMVASLSRDDALHANLVEYSIPIFYASAETPRYQVECTMRWARWEECPFDAYEVPIPPHAEPSPGSDGAMVVIDPSSGELFEFWQARRAGEGWTTSWGAVGHVEGTGWDGFGHSTGSGASRLGGVIRVAEIERGEILHALALQSDNVCKDTFRPPATRTDGESTRPDCIPEGARVRLDPEVDLDSLELAPAVRTVATAMQVYGGYVVDRSGAPLSVSFERDTTPTESGLGPVYENAGLRWDYDSLPGVPWHRLQVLAE